MKIAENEGFTLDETQVDRLIESSGNDVRQVINILQLWNSQSAEKNSNLLKKISKDGNVMLNNWDAAYRLLNHGADSLNNKFPSFRDKLDLFFVDYDWVPLLIQDSYLNALDKRSTPEDLEIMAEASEFISLGD